MKKGILLLVGVVVLLVCSTLHVLALTADMNYVNGAGVTVVAQLKGAVLEPIDSANVHIKNGNIEIPTQSGVVKVKEDYYVWFLTPYTEGNYTLQINRVATSSLGQVQLINFNQSFIVRGNLSSYAVTPGAIVTNKDFTISIFLNKEEARTIDVSFPYSHSVVLQPGANTLSFAAEQFPQEETTRIDVGGYSLPAVIPGKGSTQTAQGLRFFPDVFEMSWTRNSSVELRNLLTVDLKNVYLDYDRSQMTILPAANQTIKAGQAMVYNVSLKAGANTENGFTVTAMNENATAVLLVTLPYVLPNLTQPNLTRTNATGQNNSQTATNVTPQYEGHRCDEIDSGRICSGNTVCSATSFIDTNGDACCVGVCKAPSQGIVSNIIFGIFVLVLVGLIGFYIYVKYKKVKPEKNPIQKEVAEIEKDHASRLPPGFEEHGPAHPTKPHTP